MGMWGDIGETASDSAGGVWEMGMSLIGRALSQGDWDKASQLYQQMQGNWQNLQGPQFQQYNPQEVGSSDQVSIGSEGRNAQSSAIRNLQGFVDQGGLDAQARQANQEAISSQDQAAQASRGAIMQGAARKGMQGSGSELAAMLQGNQAAANQGRNSSLDIASQARQRALGALGQQGALAGQMRGQDIGVQQGNQNAENARNMFNAKMRMAATQGNNQNAQNGYDDQLARLQGLGQATDRVAGDYQRGAKQTAGDYASIGRAMNYQSQLAGAGFNQVAGDFGM